MAGEWLYQRDPKFLNLIQWWGPTPTDILGRECDTPPLLTSDSVEFGGHVWTRNKKITINHDNNELKVTIAKEPPIGTAGCRLFEISEAALTLGRRPGIDYDASAILDWQDWTLTQTDVSMLGYVVTLNRYYLPSKLYSHHTIYRRCPYTYRGSSCGYKGTARFTIDNKPTTDAALDVCNKSISACSLRFQIPRFGGLDVVGPNPIGTVHEIPLFEPRTYMIGRHRDFLSVLDLNTGSARRVGNEVAFGVGEDQPEGLASLNNELYMVGETNKALFKLNLQNGIATQIGEAENFGVDRLERPSGMTSIDDSIMYLVGTIEAASGIHYGALYTLDIETGIAQFIGEDTSFQHNGLASIGETLYSVGSYLLRGGRTGLCIVNRTTGKITEVGTVEDFGVGENNPQALMSLGDKLYMLGTYNDALYELDINTGEATQITTAPRLGIGETVPTGLAFILHAPNPF